MALLGEAKQAVEWANELKDGQVDRYNFPSSKAAESFRVMCYRTKSALGYNEVVVTKRGTEISLSKDKQGMVVRTRYDKDGNVLEVSNTIPVEGSISLKEIFEMAEEMPEEMRAEYINDAMKGMRK